MTSFKLKAPKLFKSNIWRIIRACFFLALSIVFLFFGWLGWLNYGNDQAMWFARSGAIVTILAGTSEAIMAAYGIGSLFQGIGGTSVIDFGKKNCKLIKAIQFLAGVMIVVGTLVWAYGDMLYSIYKVE